MNPYPARLAELHEFLRARYGVNDAQAVDIVLTAMRRGGPSIIIETDYPSRDCRPAWFNFGNADEIARSLSVPRIQRTQICEEILQSWIDETKTENAIGIFVDSEWRRLPRVDAPVVWSKVGWRALMTHTYAVLLSRCVRLRTSWPRTDRATRSQDTIEADARELARLTARVLDNDHRINRTIGPDAPPPSLFYWCELLQRIAPMQQDWDRLIHNLVAIGRGIASLYNDGRNADWFAVERVMRDTVPYCTSWILSQCDIGRSKGIKAYQAFRQSGSEFDRLMTNEIRRLAVEQVVEARRNYGPRDSYTYHPWRYRVAHHDYLTLIDREARILVNA